MSSAKKFHKSALVLTGSLLLAAGILLASAKFTPFTAMEIPWTIIDEGKVTTPDGNYHFRDRIRMFIWKANDPRVNMASTVVMNGNMDKDMTGPMWGTYHAVNGNGTWDGIWTGSFNMNTIVGEYESTGHGSGDFAGLQLKIHCVYTGPAPASCTGRILETK